MAKKKAKGTIPPCPLALLLARAQELKGRHSPFWQHLTKARIELLEAFRSLLDEQIERLKAEGKDEELTKIEVE